MATIVVVGAGLAGLACGWRLAAEGHQVRVLERADEVGGRTRSIRRGGFLLDTGAPVIAPGQRRVLALVREVGLLGSLRPLAYGRDEPGSEAAVRRARQPEGLRPGRVRSALDFQAPARRFDPHGEPEVADVLRDAEADGLGWWPAPPQDGEGPPVAAPRLASNAPHGLTGGLGSLSRALARRTESFVGCEVQRVETDSGGANVSYRDAAGGERCDRADAVVLATPASYVARICPKLSPEERGFFEQVRYPPAVVVHLLFASQPFDGARSYVLGGVAGLEVASLHAEHARPGAAPLGAGLLRAELAPAVASKLFRASDAAVADRVLESLAYSPVGALRPDDFAVSRHTDRVPVFDDHHAARLVRFVRRLDRSPRLTFAGDFLAGPSCDGAVASGFAAAREVAEWFQA